MDGGNAIFAGAKNCPCHRAIPFILNICAPWHPCHRAIPFTLNICAPWHPCHRAIPFILNIKKATLETRVAKQVISLMRESVPCELLAAVHMTTIRTIIIPIKEVKNDSHLIYAMRELCLMTCSFNDFTRRDMLSSKVIAVSGCARIRSTN